MHFSICFLSAVVSALAITANVACQTDDVATGREEGAVSPVQMKLDITNSLLQQDNTLDVIALKAHIYSVSAKLSSKAESGRDPVFVPDTRRKRSVRTDAASTSAASERPRQQCSNRGIGRRSFQTEEGTYWYGRGNPTDEESPKKRVRRDTQIRKPAAGSSNGAVSKKVAIEPSSPKNENTTPKTAVKNGTGAAPKTTTKPVQKPGNEVGTGDYETGTGGVDGCRAGNFFWSTPIRVGSATIQAIIDTGSSLTIVDGKVYSAKGAQYIKKNFTISFVDGSSAAGHVFLDTVNIANVNFFNSTIARDENGFNLDNARQYGLHGLIGLQRPGFAEKIAGIAGLLDRVRSILRHNLFSLTLTPSTGYLFLGTFDPVVPHNKWIFVPVEDDIDGHWVVKTSINGIDLPSNAVIDSGTSSMLFDHQIAKTILSKMRVQIVTEQGLLLGVFPCDRPPAISVSIGAYNRTLSAASSTLGNVNSTTCYASIVGVPTDTKLSTSAILGGPFFTNSYVGFDFSNGRMAFAGQPSP